MEHEATLLRDIALGIVFAVAAAHVARLARQPLILGYIAGGVLLSAQVGFGLVTSAASVELISEIGLILLLFIIGLEIDLRELRRMGRSMAVVSISAFPYGSDVIPKIAGVRDFFVTLFFVALGMKVPLPTGAILLQSGLILLFVFASRFLAVVPAAYFLGEGPPRRRS